MKPCTASKIHSLDVDILLDVQGFMGNSRPEIFMLRPAPVQISYLMSLGSMGTSRLDYVIADTTMIDGENRDAFTEAVITLPNCYQVNDDEARIGVIPTRAEERLPDDAMVFCAIHGGYKITRDIYTRWMRILDRTPGSVLWLSASDHRAYAGPRTVPRHCEYDPKIQCHRPVRMTEQTLQIRCGHDGGRGRKRGEISRGFANRPTGNQCGYVVLLCVRS